MASAGRFLQVSLLPEPIREVVCGYAHSLFLSRSGNVYACGVNRQGQCGVSDEEEIFTPSLVKFPSQDVRISSASAGFSHSLFLSGEYLILDSYLIPHLFYSFLFLSV